MDEGESLGPAIQRVLDMDPGDRAAVAERGCQAARASAHKTVDEWVEVLQRAVREKSFA